MSQVTNVENTTFKENFNSATEDSQNESNAGNKDTVKKIKIYIPADNYDNKLSFDQNLAEGKVKLFSEVAVDESGKTVDPVLKIPGIEINKDAPDIPGRNTSKSRNAIEENQNCSSTSFYMTKPPKQHTCDVCYQSFKQRRDLALHYVLHSEKEKRKAAKQRKKCKTCNKIPLMCDCKPIFEESYPDNNLPGYISISQLPNASLLFIKTESTSGNTNVIKRELFSCPECEQTFGLESQRKQHLLVHKRKRKATAERQSPSYSAPDSNLGNRQTFDCPNCDQSFGLEKQLKQHALVHKRERAKNVFCTVFRCSLCNEVFEDNSSLMFHAATVHSTTLSSD